MAEWTDVPNSNLEAGKPGRSTDIIAIKENIIALSEGAAGAPQMQTPAYADKSVTAAKLADNAVAALQFPTVTVGSVEVFYRFQMFTENTSYPITPDLGQVENIRIYANGTVRVSLGMSSNARAKVIKNGLTVQEWTGAGSRVLDIPVTALDIISVQLYTTSGVEGASVTNVSIKASAKFIVNSSSGGV